MKDKPNCVFYDLTSTNFRRSTYPFSSESASHTSSKFQTSHPYSNSKQILMKKGKSTTTMTLLLPKTSWGQKYVTYLMHDLVSSNSGHIGHTLIAGKGDGFCLTQTKSRVFQTSSPRRFTSLSVDRLKVVVPKSSPPQKSTLTTPATSRGPCSRKSSA